MTIISSSMYTSTPSSKLEKAEGISAGRSGATLDDSLPHAASKLARKTNGNVYFMTDLEYWSQLGLFEVKDTRAPA
jgi:hypothetical protein